MKLEAWLRQEHTRADRLLVVERLSQALNEVHDRGEPLAALQPDRVDVAGDGRCDLADARRGAPAAGYVAPERAEGGPASLEADVYAAGAIAWEVLAGSPCGPSPTHLSEACSDLPQELADAVMACLERSPQWRPRDLTYLAQLAQHARGSRKGPEVPGAAARPAARPSTVRSARAGAGRGSSDGSAATRMRLAIGAVLALAAAGGAVYLWSGRSADRRAAAPLQTTTPAVRPTAPAATAPATTPATAPTAAPSVAASTAGSSPTVATAPPPPATAVVRPTPTPTIAAAPAAASADVAARGGGARASTPAATGSAAAPAATVAAPPATAAAPPAPAPAPAAALPAAPGGAAPGNDKPAVAASVPLALSAVSPLSVRRPGKVLLDLRGSGMHEGVRVHVLPLREAPRGISIVRQKCESDSLVRVLLDLDAQVAPTAYAITIEDADGRQTKPLTFTVTR